MAYVLIVDDDRDFADAVAMVLRRAGHEVRTESRPSAAVELLAQRLPDLLILDVIFPEEASAGFHLCAAARKQHGDLPILMVTALHTQMPLGLEPSAEVCLSEATEFLEKPVDLDVLVDRVSALLKKADG